MRILVFGSTPLAHRLAYYLSSYAQVRDLDSDVYRGVLDSDATMGDVQRHVWNTYVSDRTEGRADLIINAHEQKSHILCETDPTLAWRTNTRQAAWIAYAARTANVPLLHFSSDHVFHGTLGPYSVERATDSEVPTNVYGVTKWYAEQIVTQIHPHRLSSAGTTIVRTSDLFGLDVRDSVPAQLTFRREGKLVTEGVVDGREQVSPSFIGEVAFLVARNILLTGPGVLSEPVVHIAPGRRPQTWPQYLHSVGCDVTEYRYTSGSLRRRGLVPSPGWFLPSDPKKSYNEFLSEDLEKSGSFVMYWNDEQ